MENLSDYSMSYSKITDEYWAKPEDISRLGFYNGVSKLIWNN